MWRSSKEEWERRKTYLIRSLFEDLPILSPINESQEPTLLSPNDEIYRPESPLPDLIIEKERRKYLQDETKDFYDKLAREMRRLYKRDFLNMEDDSSSYDSTGLEGVADNLIQRDVFDTESRSLEIEKCIQDTDKEEHILQTTNEETHTAASRSTTTYTESTESEVTLRHEQIITTADIHSAAVKMSKRSLHERSSSCEWENSSRSYSGQTTNTFSSPTRSDQGDHTGANEMETGPVVLEDLANTTEASAESSSQKSHDENRQYTPETMRRRQTLLSEDSLPFLELPICDSKERDISKSGGIEIASELASGSEMELADSSNDFNMLFTLTSTPKLLKKVSSPRPRIIKRYRKRLVSYSCSSSGSNDAKRHAALQTSFSDEEPASKDLWNNFFVGIPTTYNICSCSNHVCS